MSSSITGDALIDLVKGEIDEISVIKDKNKTERA